MKISNRIIFITIALVTLISFVTWQATGRDWYTKYEVVEQVEIKPDLNDPLAVAGFYDGITPTSTITRDEFRFGLLPTPNGLFDKHSVSVASVTGSIWVLGLGLFWFQRRRDRLAQK